MNMQQQAVLGFGERPGSAAERGHPLTEGQVYPLHEGGLDGVGKALFAESVEQLPPLTNQHPRDGEWGAIALSLLAPLDQLTVSQPGVKHPVCGHPLAEV